MSENPNYHLIPTENGCNICGFMNPNFENTYDLYSSYCPREFGGIAGGGARSYMGKVYPTWSQDVPERYPNHERFSWYEAVGPDWLREELKRLFPQPTNPVPPPVFNDRGKLIAVHRKKGFVTIGGGGA
jgi:hypothetical protein